MLVSRRFSRPLTLACATAAMAVAPGTALAVPASDPPAPKPGPEPVVIERASAPIRTDGDTTLALIISASALVIAAGGAGLAGRDHQRLSRLA